MVVLGAAGAEVAARFGYTPGSFSVLVHHFRQDPKRRFFLQPAKGPQVSPKSDPLREKIVDVMKRTVTFYTHRSSPRHKPRRG